MGESAPELGRELGSGGSGSSSPKPLAGKVAVVTGASRGIGRAIALRLGEDGASVAVVYISSSTGADEVVRIITEAGGEAAAFQCDVSNPEQVQAMAQAVLERFKTVDILVNNAGITIDRLFAKMTFAEFQRVNQVIVDGAFLVTQAFQERIRRAKPSGRIVFVGSVIGEIGNAAQANYAAAKAALLGFANSIAKEMGMFGVTVNVVLPGFILTEILEEMPAAGVTTAASHIPLKRRWMKGHNEALAEKLFGTSEDSSKERVELAAAFKDAAASLGIPEDVAAAVAFLASDQASYITSSVIKMDGGMLPA